MTIRLVIFDAGGFFARRLPTIRRTLTCAIEHVTAASGLSDVDLVVHPVDFGFDQFPVAAFTMGPHNVHVGIERSQLNSEELEPELFRTTVHELHHAFRWPHVLRRWTVEEIVVLEGLAVLADHMAAGPQDGVDRPLDDPEQALSDLNDIRGDGLSGKRSWLYSSEDAQPGGIARVYTLGHLLMTAATGRLGLDPWSAATRNAAELMDAGYEALTTPPPQQQRKRSA
jgi:hypothetical protein